MSRPDETIDATADDLETLADGQGDGALDTVDDQDGDGSQNADGHDPAFEALLVFLRERRGFDFTGYKRPSLMRRVRPRMGGGGGGSTAGAQDVPGGPPPR